MDKSYSQRYRGEIKRIKTEFHEARHLGLNDRAKALHDELYSLSFNHTQLMLRIRKQISEEKLEDPQLEKIRETFLSSLDSIIERQSRLGNEFVLKTLGTYSK